MREPSEKRLASCRQQRNRLSINPQAAHRTAFEADQDWDYINKTITLKASTITVLDDKFTFAAELIAGNAYFKLYNMYGNVEPVSDSGLERIINDIEKNENYEFWQMGYTIESL